MDPISEAIKIAEKLEKDILKWHDDMDKAIKELREKLEAYAYPPIEELPGGYTARHNPEILDEERKIYPQMFTSSEEQETRDPNNLKY